MKVSMKTKALGLVMMIGATFVPFAPGDASAAPKNPVPTGELASLLPSQECLDLLEDINNIRSGGGRNFDDILESGADLVYLQTQYRNKNCGANILMPQF